MQLSKTTISVVAFVVGLVLAGPAGVARGKEHQEPTDPVPRDTTVAHDGRGDSAPASTSQQDLSSTPGTDGAGRHSAAPRQVCPFEDAAHCQFDTGNFIVPIDRALVPPYRWADDFTADSSGQIQRICWWPCFFNPSEGTECAANPPPDAFEVRFYEDDAGLPGAEIGPPGGQALVPDASEYLVGTRCWLYSAPLGTPVTVTNSGCYWIEITGYGEGPDGCRVYWVSSADGNHYSMSDSDGAWGPEDVVLEIASDPAVDLSFCVDVGLAGNGCGNIDGACCVCGVSSIDCYEYDHNECRTADGAFFYPGDTCAPSPCPPPADNDECANAINLTEPAGPCETLPCTVPFSNLCAATDGPDPECGLAFGSDIWYEYHTGPDEYGGLTVSACDNGTYDGIMAVYYDGTDTCPCPGSAGTMLTCGDDTCGVFLGMPTVTFPVLGSKCYLIRVGGWDVEQGSGELYITFGSYTLFVDPDADQEPHDGSSWCNAYQTLYEALAVATPNTTIRVAEGTYIPDTGGLGDPREATFQLINEVTIEGGYAGCGEPDPDERDVVAYETVLSGDLNGDDDPGDFPDGPSLSDNCYHVVTGTDSDPTAVLEGVALTAGNADGTGPTNSDRGAGLYAGVPDGSPTVTNCTFIRNVASSFGGGAFTSYSPLYAGCTFVDNWAEDGGGMYVVGGSPTLVDCAFIDNTADGVGGNDGGGLKCSGSSQPVLIGCTFRGNFAGDSGGGMAASIASTHVTLINCTFGDNRATYYGAGMSNENNSATLVNCVFNGNEARHGGAMEVNGTADVSTTNCTFTGNLALGEAPNYGYGGGIYIRTGGSATLANCVVWGNTDSDGTDESAQIYVVSGTASVSYSLIQGLDTFAGNNNVDGDPLFIDADGPDDIAGTDDDDVRLSQCSPAIDAADNDAVPLDTHDLDDDENTTEPIPIDYFGRPRFLDDPFTDPDPGNPGSLGPPVVDMGVHELAPPVFVDRFAGGLNDGSSWTNAYNDLQDGLAAAEASDGTVTEIWVAAGTCTPDDPGVPPVATFQLLNGVALYGGFAGTEACRDERDIEVNETILSGDLNGNDDPDDFPGGPSFVDNSYHVVTGSGTDSSAVLDGFTITAGNDPGLWPDGTGGGMLNVAGSPAVLNCTFEGNSAFFGGGMYNYTEASPTLTNCTFRDNAAAEGGAVHNYTYSSPTLTGCTFTGNWGSDDGGAMYNDDGSSPVLTDCTFSGNWTNGRGGAIHNWLYSSPTLTNCSFSGNSAEDGGGMHSQNASSPTLVGCTFSGNSADDRGGALFAVTGTPQLVNCTLANNTAQGSGGGMYNTDSIATLVNCTFFDNEAGANGGGVFSSDGSSPTLINCTLASNSAVGDGGGIGNFNGTSAAVTNCVFWENSHLNGVVDESAQIYDDGSGTPVVSYSLIHGLDIFTGNGNIGDNPMFVDAVYGNLRLRPGSPAIDAADNTAVPPDSTDLDDDGNTSEAIPLDLGGIPRFYDDPDTVDSGNGIPPIVDMGAYEFVTDCNGNGLPDECDLDCEALGGQCDLPGCGQSADCNTNENPDECDIAECIDDPACDDCNLNGVPDACDIESGTSEDIDEDGVPDECAFFIGGADNLWSNPDNWDLDGDIPNNDPEGTYSVTIDVAGGGIPLDVDDVFVDIDVTIDSLRVLGGAQLGITQTGSEGDLTIASAGGILNEGRIFVANDREVYMTGAVLRMRDGGVYMADPDAGDPVSASLTAGTIILERTLPGNEDQMTLTDTMVVTIEGSLVMDGTGATIPCLRGDRNLGDARGGYTPPVLKYYGASNMNITLDLEMQGTVVVFGDSGQPIALGGDHSNQSQSPECFDCTNAIFRLNGLEPRTFEVGGRNLGSVPAGFESNFAIGTVEVAADGNVTFTDAFDNDAEGQGPCTEALYVHELILGANSTVKLDNCRVYYETLVDYGATLAAIGCGELLEMQDMVNPPLAEDNGDGPCASDGECPNAAACIGGVCYVPKNRYLSIRRNPDNSGYHTARRVRVETATSGTVLLGWVDEPVLDPVEDIWTALLVDEPVYNGVDFAGEWPDVVHVKGCEIVPGQTYVIQAIMDGQSVGDESNYSEALALPSAPVWGDVVGICPFDVCEPPEGDPFTQPNIDDVLALVNAFVGIDNAPLTWLDIDPVVGNGYPEGYVVIGDVLAVVNAFSGQQYPGDGPVGCE